MVPGPFQAEINSILLPSSTAQMSDMPFDAEVVAAYLFWSGATPRTLRGRLDPPDLPDRDVDFTLPDGTFYNDLSVDTDLTGFATCRTADALGGFYYCRRDVTDIVAALGAGNANGIYTVGDVDADPGTLDSADGQRIHAQAKYAGWSLVVVWRGPASQTVRRDVVLYDGFLRLDETSSAAGIHSFSIGDFSVGEPPLGRLSVFGMEGDRQLGVPPQDSTGCSTCYDFVSFRAASAATATKLSDGDNPENNSFNSSTDTSIDIDTYYLDGLIATGDASATITLGSGDGVVDGTNNQGNGESFFVGWVIMTVDTLTPSFSGIQTRKTVVPAAAAPGQPLVYIIDIANEGSLAATHVMVTDAIPANTTYVAGSTTVDGVEQADVGGTSPLVGGLALGTIPTSRDGDNSRRITFQVEVEAGACGGDIQNLALVEADDIDPVTVGPATTTVAVPFLDPPEKRVSFISAPPVGPGAALTYTIDINNSGSIPAAGITVVDPLPEHMLVSSVFSTSGSWSIDGGTLTVTDLEVSAGGSAQVVVTGRARNVSEFVAAGVSENDIDGLLISNQAAVSGGCTAEQLTDDPDAPGFQPTEFTLVYRPALDTSAKDGIDINGGRLEPGDIVEYSITVANTGNRATDVVVRDAVPAHTTYVPNSTRVDGNLVGDDPGPVSPLAAGLTLPSLPFVGDNDRVITFQVAVDLLAPNGSVIQNSADLDVPVYPPANLTVVSPPLTVFAAPEWDTSTKAYADLDGDGEVNPGDLIEYTITVSNTGNRPATGVTVTDVLSAHLEFVSASSPGSFDGNSVTWDLDTIPVAGARTLTVRATVVSPLDDGTLISNVAVITCNELPAFTTPAATFSVSSAPVLLVEKVRFPDNNNKLVVPGEAAVFRVRVSNTGTMVARGLVVTDPIDSALLTHVMVPGGSFSGGVATWDLGDLSPADGVVELQLAAEVVLPLPDGTLIANQATATASGLSPAVSDDPATPAVGDPTTLVVTSQATVAFHKTVEDLAPATPYQPGDRVRYTLTLTAGLANTAPVRDAVVVDDVQADLIDIDAGMSGGTVVGNRVEWSAAEVPGLGRLDPGDAVVLVFEAGIAPGTADGTPVDNQALLSSGDLAAQVPSDDPGTPAAADPTRFVVVSEPVLLLEKTVSLPGGDTEFNPGDTVTYSVLVRNIGTAAANTVVVVDAVDTHLTNVAVTGGQYDSGSHAVSWSPATSPDLTSIAAGDSVALTFSADILLPLDDGTVVSNQASGSAADFPGPALSDDPALPGATDPTDFTVVSAPDLSDTDKQVVDLDPPPENLVTRPGDAIRYTLVVPNTGTMNARGVVLTDDLPVELTGATPGTPSHGLATLTLDTLTWSIGDLAAGEVATLTVDATVATPLPNGTLVSNQAFVRSDEITTPVPSDDLVTPEVDDPTELTVVSASDLGGSTKRVNGMASTAARPDEVVTFTIEVSNRGDAAADNVVVTDPVSPYLLIVDAPRGTIDAVAHTVTWDATTVPELATLPPGGPPVVLTFDARLELPLDNGLVILNQAEIDEDRLVNPVLTDADPSTINKDETAITVISAPDLTASTKEFVDPITGTVLASVRPGEEIRMLITLINSGDAIARDVRVEDVVDTTLLIVGGDPVKTWSGLEVSPAPGGEVTLHVDALVRTPLDPTTLSNQAFIGIGEPPTIPTDDPATAEVDDPTELPIVSSVDLSASTKDVRSPAGRQVGPGETIRYEIQVGNSGDGNAHDLVVTDPLDNRLEFVAASCGTCYDSPSRTVTWSLPLVPGGSAAELWLEARVVPLTPNGTIIANQARLAGSDGLVELTDDPLFLGEPDRPTRVTVVAAPAFASFTKAVEVIAPTAPGMLEPGDSVRYTLRLRNDGNATATQVVVRDPLDTDHLVNPVPETPFRREGDDLVFDAGTVAALAAMDPGDEVTLTFLATVAPGVSDGTVIANQGHLTAAELTQPVSSDSADGSLPGPSDPTVITVAYPDLEVVKSFVDDNGGDPEPGDVIRFAVRVTNNGSFAAAGVAVTDVVTVAAGAGFTDVVPDAGGSLAGDTITWTRVGDLDPGQAWTVGFAAAIRDDVGNGVVLENLATVSGDNFDARTSNTVSLTVVSVPSFHDTEKRVVTPAGGREVGPGDVVTYTIEAPNTGSGKATSVELRDLVDDNLEVVRVSVGGSLEGDEIVWRAGEIPKGGSVRVDFDARVRASTPNRTVIANQATVTAAELSNPVLSDDPSTADPDDPTELTVVVEPTFAATTLTAVDVNGGDVSPGDLIRFELRVVNSGNTPGVDTHARLPTPSYLNVAPESTHLNGELVPDMAGDPPLATGLRIRSQGTGEDGLLLADDGQLPADEHALVTFDAQVDPRAVPGTAITAQATITAFDAQPGVSDNPATPGIPGDATTLVVGGGAALAVAKTATLLVDAGEDGSINPGDVMRYRIVVNNAGTTEATDAILEDALPAEVSYSTGTLQLDGAALTDRFDADAGEVRDGHTVQVRLGDLAPQGQMVVTFDVSVTAGPVVSNQATARAGSRSWLSDGDPTVPGAQPTIHVVDPARELVTVTLLAGDLTGGVVEPGDRIRLVLTAANDSAFALDNVELAVAPPTLAAITDIIDSGTATPIAADPPRWQASLRAGERVRVEIEVTVDAETDPGQVVETTASAVTPANSFESEPLRLVIGGGTDSGAFAGTVYRNLGTSAGGFDSEEDEPLGGFSILLVPSDRIEALGRDAGFDLLALRTVVSDESGAYQIVGVPPGRYELWAASGEATVFRETEPFEVTAGDSHNLDFAVDPSGIIYQERDGIALPVAGARVYLVDATTGEDVDRTDLFGGQQGQVTTGQGYYRFDVRGPALPGSFSLRVEPPSDNLVFPSILRPPAGATAADPLGEAAEPPADGRIVPNAVPELSGDTRYYLRFDIDAATPDITNNHVPLDRLAQHIRITKQASRRTATIGEIISYTVRIENPLNDGILVDDAGLGGVELVDDLPRGIRWPRGGRGTITTVVGGVVGGPRSLATQGPDPRTTGVVRFEGFSLPGRSVVSVRYYTVVGINARGEQVNRARLVNAGGGLLSDEAEAIVRVVEDPIFDQGTVLGRVFCDSGDGELGPEAQGLPGARVYMDTGFFADTDVEGKYHFRGVPPGRHVIKVDPNTVPPGSEPITSPLRDFFTSRGLLTKINFGFRCGLEPVQPSHVRLKEAPPRPTALVAVDPAVPAVALDGRAEPLPLVDAAVTLAGEKPDFDAGLGLNLGEPVALTWHVRVPSRIPIRSWEISVFTVEGEEVWRLSGDGRPPARIPWQLTAESSPFDVGRLYLFRIAAETSEGNLGEGRWRRLGVRVGAPAETAPPGPLATWRGRLFRKRSDEPTRRLRSRIDELVASLADARPKLRVEVHLVRGRRRNANLMLSERRAAAIKKLLVAAGWAADDVRAIGRGDAAPLMPNVTRKARRRNERIEIRADEPTFEPRPFPPVAYPGWLRIGAASLASVGLPGEGERLEREVEIEAGERLMVDLRQPNGQRVRLSREYPFGTTTGASRPTVEIPLSGNLTKGEVVLGGVPLALPLFSTACYTTAGPVALTPDGLDPPVRFHIETGAEIESWVIRILNPEGTVLRELTGEGTPPEAVEWQGKSATGAVVVRPGRYQFRCLLTDVDGNRAVTAPRVLALPMVEAGSLYSRTFVQDDYPDESALQTLLRTELDRVAAKVLANPGSRARLEVHDNTEGGKSQAQVRSARLASVLRQALMERGVASGAISVSAFGAAQPLMAGTSRAALEKNRRLLIEVLPPPTVPPGEPPKPRVRVAGVQPVLSEDGSFSGRAMLESDAEVVVELASGDGRTAIYTIPTFEGRPVDTGGASGAVIPQGSRPAPGSKHKLGSGPASLIPAAEPVAAAPAPAAVNAHAGQVPESSGPVPNLPPAAPRAQVGEEAVATSAETADAVGAEPASASVTLPIDEAPAATLAADLRVLLPPDGAELGGERLAVRGRTDPGNRVTINGATVEVDDTGQFAKVLTLEPGEARVAVVAEDAAGNVAEVTRAYQVPNGEWFLVAMADGAAGWGSTLEGMNEDTVIDSSKDWVPDEWPDELYLHGRAVGYFKGRVKGSSLFAGNPFDDMRVTAHVDTGKERDADLLKQLIDPERYYPVYGDNVLEVQDVATRHKAYLLIEADQSRLTVGNFKTQIDGLELFRFHRTYFGGSLDLDHEFVDGFRTEVHAFAASGETGLRHRQIVMQGTGGSIYFLRDGEIVEGSERVELVVRDATTGARLLTVPQVRDTDYTISYREGRLIFSKPVPSIVTAGWRIHLNPLSTLDGHKVFVELEYDHRSSGELDGETAFAFQARQTLFDRITVGGGIVDEDGTAGGGPHYQLVGGDLQVELLPNTHLTAELAWSRAEDADHLVSFDGGVTYGRIGSAQLQDRGLVAGDGWAGKVQVAGDLLEILAVAGVADPRGVSAEEEPAAKMAQFMPYTVYFQHQDPGFFSGSTVMEQGQTKLGAQMRLVLTEQDGFRLRHDGVWSEIYLDSAPRQVNRQITALGYERDMKTWKAGAEYGHTYWDDGDHVVHTDTLAVYGEATLTERLTCLVEQDAVLQGDTRVIDAFGDRFATTVGARYQVADWLELTATESVRWSGANSTQVGLKSKLDEEISLYAQERLTAGAGQTVSTTVVGGESTAIPGSRSYAEYQLDALATGQTGRAVFGMDNRWTLVDGLKLNLAYERSQLIGAGGSTTTAPFSSTGYAVEDREVTGYGSSALGTQQFTASGYSSAGVFPVGVASRDSFAIGLEFLRLRTLKAGARFEIRYDRGDADLGAYDRLMFAGSAGGDWRLDRNLVALGRVRGATVHNLDFADDVGSGFGFVEGQYMDVSLGLALRPVRNDTFEGLFKWTRRFERRPVGADLSQFTLEVSDVIALEPVVEIGYGLQVVGKLAVKVFAVQDADLPELHSTTLLGLGRVNYHLADQFDVGAEYRWLGNFLTDESEHGALVEVAWLPVRYVAVGVGYNFTHFSDDLLADPRFEPHGFFLRVTGRF
jgi:uncharacterized repeat protein (TIGR01451 family)